MILNGFEHTSCHPGSYPGGLGRLPKNQEDESGGVVCESQGVAFVPQAQHAMSNCAGDPKSSPSSGALVTENLRPLRSGELAEKFLQDQRLVVFLIGRLCTNVSIPFRETRASFLSLSIIAARVNSLRYRAAWVQRRPA
jgi:hypothetical protein